MGWTFEYGTRWLSRKEYAENIIRECTATWEHNGQKFSTRPLAHSLRGNDLWVVMERTHHNTGEVNTWIALYRLSKHEGMWGYKDMDEDCGPYFHTCPLKFLKMTEPKTDYSREWRERVRQYHNYVNARRRAGKSLRGLSIIY